MNTDTVYHYVYRITNTKINKHYYGKRSSKRLPIEDIGKYYFSSSKDKEFIKDQKNNPQNYKYKIISLYTTTKEALQKEIKLHNKFDVGINPNFYNRSKQTSTGFDTTGTSIKRVKKDKTLPKIDKRKLPKSDEYKKIQSSKLTGKVRSSEQKLNYSLSKQGIKHPKAKLANIYEYNTNKLIATNIVISEWCRDNGFDRNGLLQTVKGDINTPASRVNRCQYKNMYARYINVL